MVEKGVSKRFDGRAIEERDSISLENLLKFIRSNSEGLSLQNIESLRKIILPMQEKILGNSKS